MVKFMLLSVLVTALLWLNGCEGVEEQLDETGSANPPVEVTIEGGGTFPAFLTGRWRSDDGGWEIIFDRDGHISELTHSLGRVKLKPGQVIRAPMRGGRQSVYIPGQWFVSYRPSEKLLVVTIELERFHLEIGGGTVDGNSVDVFTGPVDEESLVWTANRTRVLQGVINTERYADFNVSTDPEYGESSAIVFRRVQ